MALGKTIDKIAGAVGATCAASSATGCSAGYTQQAGEIILQGALPEQVDNVINEFGMPMGPFAMNDLVGLDLGWRARQMADQAGDVPLTARVADKLCALGRFGQKTKPATTVTRKAAAGIPDPEVAKLIVETSMNSASSAARSATRKCSSAACIR